MWPHFRALFSHSNCTNAKTAEKSKSLFFLCLFSDNIKLSTCSALTIAQMIVKSVFVAENHHHLTINYVQKRLWIAIHCSGNAACTAREKENEHESRASVNKLARSIRNRWILQHESRIVYDNWPWSMLVSSLFVFSYLLHYFIQICMCTSHSMSIHTFRNCCSKSGVVHEIGRTRKW